MLFSRRYGSRFRDPGVLSVVGHPPRTGGPRPARMFGASVASAAHPLPRPDGPQEEGHRHPPGQRLVGGRPAPADARLRPPRLGHLRPGPGGVPALHLLRDPALEVVQLGDHRRDRIGRRDGAPDQADQLPEARPAGRGGLRRDRQLLLRPDPARRADAAVLPASHQPMAARDPGRRRRAAPVHPAPRDRPGRRSTSSIATSATSPGTSCGWRSMRRLGSIRWS